MTLNVKDNSAKLRGIPWVSMLPALKKTSGFVGGEGPKGRLARHYYDLWCLISKGVAKKAAADLDLFKRVAAHRAVFFQRKKEAQETLKPGTIRILPTTEHKAAWKKDYEAMRESMFFGDTPDFEKILEVVGKFESEFNGVASG